MEWILYLLLWDDRSHLGTTEDRVDVIEVNHFYDEKGKLVFDQVLFYRWSPVGRYDVVDWKLLKRESQYPIRDWTRKAWVAVFYDGPVLRTVIATSYRETWTQYDPELTEREFLPKEKRRLLPQPVSFPWKTRR